MKKVDFGRRSLCLIISCALVFESPVLFAAGGRATNSTVPVTTAIENTSTTATGAVNPLTVRNPTVVDTSATNTKNAELAKNQSGNAVNLGNQASGAQGGGQAAGLIGAAISGAMAAATCPNPTMQGVCIASIIGALASLAVAGAMGGAKGVSDQTVADVTTTTTGTPTTKLTDPLVQRSVDSTERDLDLASRAAGLKTNPKTGTLKFSDGRTLDVNKLGDSNALAAAGFSKSEIAAFQKGATEALQKGALEAQKNPDAFNSGGGGDGGVAMGSSGKSGGTEILAAERKESGTKRDPAQVAGLSKNFNGDPIGVASENLFTLINRRYSYAGDRNTFLVSGQKILAVQGH